MSMDPGWLPSGQSRHSKVSLEPALAGQTRATPFWPLTPMQRVSKARNRKGTAKRHGLTCSQWKKRIRHTTSHVIASDCTNGADGKCCRLNVVWHTDAGSVALRNIINKEVREESVSIDCTSSNSGEQHAGETREMHDEYSGRRFKKSRIQWPVPGACRVGKERVAGYWSNECM